MATLIEDKHEAWKVESGSNEPPPSLSLIVLVSKREHVETE